MRVIHLSDLHIGRSDNIEKTERIVNWILNNQDKHRSKVIVITGDNVNDGAEWQYQEARNLYRPLWGHGYQLLIAPGNHDYGPLGVTESRESARDFKRYLSGQVDFPHLEIIQQTAFIILDSMKGEIRSVEMWGAEGQIGKVQLQELEKQLSRLEDDPAVERVVILLHHHPFDYKKFHVLRDASRLLEVIRGGDQQQPQVQAVLFGHKHLDHRFNQPPRNYEKKYGIDLIYAAGSAVERDEEGDLTLPVIDFETMRIERFRIK